VRPLSKNDVRGFGLVMFTAALLLAWKLRAHGSIAVGACVATGFALGAASFLTPSLVRPLAAAWRALGLLLGRVTTPLLLTLVFVLVVIPLRALLTVLRLDPLKLRFERTQKTHFVERPKKTFDKADFERLS
jgi:hypothetical protein